MAESHFLRGEIHLTFQLGELSLNKLARQGTPIKDWACLSVLIFSHSDN